MSPPWSPLPALSAITLCSYLNSADFYTGCWSYFQQYFYKKMPTFTRRRSSVSISPHTLSYFNTSSAYISFSKHFFSITDSYMRSPSIDICSPIFCKVFYAENNVLFRVIVCAGDFRKSMSTRDEFLKYWKVGCCASIVSLIRLSQCILVDTAYFMRRIALCWKRRCDKRSIFCVKNIQACAWHSSCTKISLKIA